MAKQAINLKNQIMVYSLKNIIIKIYIKLLNNVTSVVKVTFFKLIDNFRVESNKWNEYYFTIVQGIQENFQAKLYS